MKNVTPRLRSYRECARHLWNTYFLDPVAGSSDKWALRDQFDDVCAALFGALVVEPLGLAPVADAASILSPSRTRDPRVQRWLRVVPNAPAGVPIMINRDPLQSDGYWDHPLRRVTANEVDLRLVHWFDFDELAFRDFRYYLVRAVAASREDVVGRAALIECEYTDVMLDEGQFSP